MGDEVDVGDSPRNPLTDYLDLEPLNFDDGRDSPFTQISLNKGGSLSWGGLLEHHGTWLSARGWNAPAGVRELHFYRSAQGDSTPLG